MLLFLRFDKNHVSLLLQFRFYIQFSVTITFVMLRAIIEYHAAGGNLVNLTANVRTVVTTECSFLIASTRKVVVEQRSTYF